MRGLWSEQPSPPPLPPGHVRCLLCPTCSATCRLKTSHTPLNPDRQFYTCPATAQDHKFFKWADEVNPDELIDVPYCGGCRAGVCRVRKEESGPNAGRILFMCRIKEGEGSCGYRVWKDELEMPTRKADERKTSSPSNTTNVYDTGPANAVLVEESIQNDEVGDKKPPVIEISQHLQCTGSTSGNMGNLKCQEDKPNESFRPFHNADPTAIKPLQVVLDAPSCSDPLSGARYQNVMPKSISKAFGQAAEDLKSKFLTVLETMDVQDHEIMSQEAEATFAALDRLMFDYQDLKEHTHQLIHCAIELSEIEKSMPRNDSYQKWLEQCSSERVRLDEINHVHAKIVHTVTGNKTHLKALQEQISSAKDWLLKTEAELSSCEVEMKDMEHELERISENKEILEERYHILEHTQKLRELKEVEYNATKAKFDTARALLRGYKCTM